MEAPTAQSGYSDAVTKLYVTRLSVIVGAALGVLFARNLEPVLVFFFFLDIIGHI